MKDADVPYLLRGQKELLKTDSSCLISSSVYLNEPRLRDWISTHYLRRSGKDLRSTTDTYKLYLIWKDIYPTLPVEELFTAERKRWPELDRWFNEKFISTYTADDLLKYPEGSLGYTFGKYIVDKNFDIEIMPRFEPQNQFEYYNLRSAQTHDLEHLIFGGCGFDFLGELIPYYVRLSNIPRFLTPELAGYVNFIQLLGSTRILMRAGLHYTATYPTALRLIQCGMRVGEEAGPIFMTKYEDYFHMTIPQVREKLGLTTVVDIDSTEFSRMWDEYR